MSRVSSPCASTGGPDPDGGTTVYEICFESFLMMDRRRERNEFLVVVFVEGFEPESDAYEVDFDEGEVADGMAEVSPLVEVNLKRRRSTSDPGGHEQR